jgi:hypothetical protein
MEANLFLAPGEGDEQPAADDASRAAGAAQAGNDLTAAVRLLRG